MRVTRSQLPALALAALWALLAAGPRAHAAKVDVEALYEVSAEGPKQKLAAGSSGTFVLEIKVKDGAYVSEEAPLKLLLAGEKVAPHKTTLTLADQVAKKADKLTHVRFEVPVLARDAGQGKVEANLTFFLCTADLCVRQKKVLSVPVEVQ